MFICCWIFNDRAHTPTKLLDFTDYYLFLVYESTLKSDVSSFNSNLAYILLQYIVYMHFY